MVLGTAEKNNKKSNQNASLTDQTASLKFMLREKDESLIHMFPMILPVDEDVKQYILRMYKVSITQSPSIAVMVGYDFKSFALRAATEAERVLAEDGILTAKINLTTNKPDEHRYLLLLRT